MLSRTSALFFLLFVTLVSFNFAEAQDSAGIGISPSLIEEPLNPGASYTDVITVKNLGSSEETYYIYVRDISGVTDGGRPIYADENLPETGFEMSTWVTVASPKIVVPPGGEYGVPIIVEVPSDASPGSHFGAIFASKTAPDQVDLGAGVGFQIANIVSIRVAGDAVVNAQIRSFQTDKFLYGSKSVEFAAKLENKGNVLLRPAGPIEITNMLGSKVATIILNESKGGLFPASNREFNVLWEDSSLGFGRYTATLGMVYGESGQSQSSISSVTTFWVLPWVIIKPLLISLAVIFVLSYFIIKNLVRAQVTKLSGGRRLVRSTGDNSPSIFILLTIVMLVVTAFALFVLLLLFA